jgi:hypothetical protein
MERRSIELVASQNHCWTVQVKGEIADASLKYKVNGSDIRQVDLSKALPEHGQVVVRRVVGIHGDSDAGDE